MPAIPRPPVLLELIHEFRDELKRLDRSEDHFNSQALLKQVRGALGARPPATVQGCLLLRWCLVAKMPPSELRDYVTIDEGDWRPFDDAYAACGTHGGRGFEDLLAERTPPLTFDDAWERARTRSVLETGERNIDFDKIPVARPYLLVAELLQRQILCGAFEVGQVITKQCAESRGGEELTAAVRDLSSPEFVAALQILFTGSGLIDREFAVRRLSPAEIEDVVDMRQLLECMLAGRWATARKSEDICQQMRRQNDGLKKVLTTCQQAEDTSDHRRIAQCRHEFTEIDMEFHLLLCGGRPMTRKSLKYLLQLLRMQRVNFRPPVNAGRMQLVVTEHDRILDQLQPPVRLQPLQHAVAAHIRASLHRDES